MLQDQKEKSPYRQSSRLCNQQRKDYKTFIAQSNLFKKLNIKNRFKLKYIFTSENIFRTFSEHTEHFLKIHAEKNFYKLVQNQAIRSLSESSPNF